MEHCGVHLSIWNMYYRTYKPIKQSYELDSTKQEEKIYVLYTSILKAYFNARKYTLMAKNNSNNTNLVTFNQRNPILFDN